MTTMPHPYDAPEPARTCQVAEAPEIPTAVVVQHDFPMYDMPALMDGVFSHLADALAAQGVRPIGPALALHHRRGGDRTAAPYPRPALWAYSGGGGGIEARFVSGAPDTSAAC